MMHSLEFCHTGDIESLNALLLKYAKKTHIYRLIILFAMTMIQVLSFYKYSWLGMLMRSILAAIDWNENCDRLFKISSTGETIYKRKVE